MFDVFKQNLINEWIVLRLSRIWLLLDEDAVLHDAILQETQLRTEWNEKWGEYANELLIMQSLNVIENFWKKKNSN